MRAVRSGACERLVRLAYAPNHTEPMDIFYEMTGRGERQSPEFFSHPKMAERYPATAIGAALAQGRHFFDETLRWNGCIEAGDAGNTKSHIRTWGHLNSWQVVGVHVATEAFSGVAMRT